MDAVDRPIGIFDSGFGGLSVARVIRARLPQENFIYAADCGHAPWGTRPDDYVRRRAEHLAHFLLSQNVKAIVVACHTASAVVGDDLAAQLPVPVIRIAPPVREALAASRVHCIGVMATSKTVTSKSYLQIKSEALSSYPNARIVDQGCPGLMECVERGEFKSAHTLTLLEHYIAPLLAKGTDRLVLGCTHYVFIKKFIENLYSCPVFDGISGTADHLRTLLGKNDHKLPGKGKIRFFCGDFSKNKAVFEKFRHFY